MANEVEQAGPKRPAPSSVHRYAVAKIKTFRGMDGEGLNAVLLKDGKQVAEILNEGSGGMTLFYWIDRNQGVEEGLFEAFIEAERLKIPADKESHEGFNDRKLFCADIWVDDEVSKAKNDRRFRRACKTNTLFQVGRDIGPEGRVFQAKGVGPQVRAWIEKKYAGQPIKFLNDEFRA